MAKRWQVSFWARMHVNEEVEAETEREAIDLAAKQKLAAWLADNSGPELELEIQDITTEEVG